MFRKFHNIVTLAALFVGASAVSGKGKNAFMRKVREFQLCTNDQAEFNNEIYDYFYGPIDTVKPLYHCKVSVCDCSSCP